MTIQEAIAQIDILKPNGYSDGDKIRWLSTLDGIVKTEIIDTHTGGGGKFEGYNEDVDPATVLLVPAPYSDVYLRYLEAQIDYANGEYAKYNNTVAAYNSAYSAFERYYNRTHMPLGNKFTFF